MLALHLASATPLWVPLASGLGSGTLGSLFGAWQARRLIPSEVQQLESAAAKAAVETVETALHVAQDRITGLEDQVRELTSMIGGLRQQLREDASGRARIEEALTLALTERARLEQQIADINRRLESKALGDLVRVESPDAILMVDLEEGKISYANDGVFGLFGYLPSQLIGASIDFLVPEEDRSTHMRERLGFAAHPRQRQMGSGLPLRALTATGRIIAVDISLHPTGDGRVIALVKRAQESAER